MNLANDMSDTIRIYEKCQPARNLPLRQILVGVFTQIDTIEDLKNTFEFQKDMELKKIANLMPKLDRKENVLWIAEGESVLRHKDLTGLHLKGHSGDVSFILG